MNRRGFLGKLAAAPVTAGAATSIVGAPSSLMQTPYMDAVGTECLPRDPFEFAVDEAMRAVADKDHGRFFVDVPYFINEKRSWSTAFKQHCAFQEREESRVPWNGSTADKVAWLAKRGIKVVL